MVLHIAVLLATSQSLAPPGPAQVAQLYLVTCFPSLLLDGALDAPMHRLPLLGALAPQGNRSLVWFSLPQARLPCPSQTTQDTGQRRFSEGLAKRSPSLQPQADSQHLPPQSPSLYFGAAGVALAAYPVLFTWAEWLKVLFSLALDLSDPAALKLECWSLQLLESGAKMDFSQQKSNLFIVQMGN